MLRQSALVLLLAIGASGTALAMDVPPPVYAPETSIDGVGQGWYMRGDLGYTGWVGDQSPEYNILDGAGAVSSVRQFDDSRFDKNVSYGLGAGYQVNDIFRADATLDFFSSGIDGQSRSASLCDPAAPAGTTCRYAHSGDLSTIGLMGNLYADLGTFAGFTPYVGAGAGMTHVAWDKVSEQATCVNGAGNCGGAAFAKTSYDGTDSWRFTYALMAGLSYDVTSSMKLDLGYRYSKIKGGDMYEYSAAEQAEDPSGAKGKDDGLSRHEIRAGFRFNTW